MADHSFFLKLYRHFMRHDGTVLGIFYMTPDGQTPIEGLFVLSNPTTRRREILFDPSKWEVKTGLEPMKFSPFEDVFSIWLGPSSSGNGEDLPLACRDNLKPKDGSGLAWPETILPKFDLWIRADCPD
ncbi:hypothetical protein A3C09_02110 [Candidatus Uhrbacteria bacterium RIFCSPHIGHO2_02_FULL_47_44]|uniref:Uncharacterized protein n=1 Tax=Candidatus Uhrbacteria bacterium RIFCSPLOWO2_02_FULL_48_18 TaxID=1802408 RepID=A0A1F7VBM7_9BACT|nr:MAG: hypothetical protein A2839_00490 [Candidatus Uhrbacteria bacterium RIFCSPHIGHO2_01_FULL_47_10]OGL70474.1 MAG: hypothetical protein A3C09_02110 [Candidatus Uhrbacteria bacterium RIFCSPHIGHO2_02_FULL_47_44]OGL76834.1 MAG: hypothetical protein A3E97_01665 [Candidatus Uhrbacteria bacterium RIFCSPHIGHO2_12_FULL_47_12]OGL82303.1 MAG: hypothetical protein A3B20_00945 [Candidatus Uhrbacteria bacterium RIFCSPLOWO2_01_FULL_47_17]OGL87950.1 MAG: hypothetical protein A3I41_02475 [Candidatus Uhrbact